MFHYNVVMVARERFNETARSAEQVSAFDGYYRIASNSRVRQLLSGLGARLAAYERYLRIRPDADRRGALPDCGTPDTVPC